MRTWDRSSRCRRNHNLVDAERNRRRPIRPGRGEEKCTSERTAIRRVTRGVKGQAPAPEAGAALHFGLDREGRQTWFRYSSAPARRRRYPVARVKKVDDAALKLFREEGYMLAEGILDSRKDIKPVIAEYTELIDALCRLARRGSPVLTYADMRSAAPLTSAEETGERYERPSTLRCSRTASPRRRDPLGPASPHAQSPRCWTW